MYVYIYISYEHAIYHISEVMKIRQLLWIHDLVFLAESSPFFSRSMAIIQNHPSQWIFDIPSGKLT